MATFRTVAVLKRHVSQIRPGDVVWYRNDWRTVSGTDLKRQPDGTLTLFGTCLGGGFQGSALTATEATLESVARRWWRQYLAKQSA